MRNYLRAGDPARRDLHRAELRRRVHDPRAGWGPPTCLRLYQTFFVGHEYGQASAAGVDDALLPSRGPARDHEAAEFDGARLPTLLRRIVMPVAAPGIAATALICFIFAWNELMFARVITSTVASTSPVFLTGFITSEGLFLAKLCAAAMVVSLPVLAAGLAAQDKLRARPPARRGQMR
jgi:hypothetical protein